MLHPLLLSVALACQQPAPEPHSFSVDLVHAEHPRSVQARDFVSPTGVGPEISEADLAATCDWFAGQSANDGVANSLLTTGKLGYTILEIHSAGILLDGQQIIDLTRGRFSAEQLRGQVNGTLYDALLKRAETHKAIAEHCRTVHSDAVNFEGRILLGVAPSMPYETVRSVLYTAGQAQFGGFYLAVDGVAGAAVPKELSKDGQQLAVALDGAKRGVTRRYNEKSALSAAPLKDQMPGLLTGPLGCGLLVPSAASRWQAIIATMDEMSVLGAERFIIAGGVASESPVNDAVATVTSSLSLSLQTRVPVFYLQLPFVGPPTRINTPILPECSAGQSRDIVAERND